MLIIKKKLANIALVFALNILNQNSSKVDFCFLSPKLCIVRLFFQKLFYFTQKRAVSIAKVAGKNLLDNGLCHQSFVMSGYFSRNSSTLHQKELYYLYFKIVKNFLVDNLTLLKIRFQNYKYLNSSFQQQLSPLQWCNISSTWVSLIK